MGAVTPIDKVWYPDETDIDQPNVYMATHAQSIEDGIGARLRQQEVAVGLKANLPPSSFTLTSTGKTLPYQVTNDFGAFSQGLSIAGGVITIETKGMYVVTSSIGIPPTGAGTASLVISLYRNSTRMATNEVSAGAHRTSAQVNCALLCEPGDTIYTRGAVSGANVANSADGEMHFISIAMVQAVPPA